MVKAQGSRVFALGVGAAVTTPTSARRLTAISGFDRYPGTPFKNADYTLVKEFDRAGGRRSARSSPNSAARGSVSRSTSTRATGSTWRMADGTSPRRVSVPGGFSWILPATATGESATATTGDGGIARFLWRPNDLEATSTVDVVDERTDPGYSYVIVHLRRQIGPSRAGGARSSGPPLPILAGSRDSARRVRHVQGVQQDQPGDDRDREGCDAGEPSGVRLHGDRSAPSRWWITSRTSRCRARSPTSRPGPTRSASSFRRTGSSRASPAPPKRAATHHWSRGGDHARYRRCRHLHLQRHRGSTRRYRRSRRSRRRRTRSARPGRRRSRRARLRRPPSSEWSRRCLALRASASGSRSG